MAAPGAALPVVDSSHSGMRPVKSSCPMRFPIIRTIDSMSSVFWPGPLELTRNRTGVLGFAGGVPELPD